MKERNTMGTIYGMEINEFIRVVMLILLSIGMGWVIAAIIKIKIRIKQFEEGDIKEKELILETAVQLKLATVETAANLKEATVETAKHLKETTIETAYILAAKSTGEDKPRKILESIDKKLDQILIEVKPKE